MEVLRIDYSFYTYFTNRGVIKVLSINYSLYTYVINRVVINLIVFYFPRELLGGIKTNFRTLGSPRIGRL